MLRQRSEARRRKVWLTRSVFELVDDDFRLSGCITWPSPLLVAKLCELVLKVFDALEQPSTLLRLACELSETLNIARMSARQVVHPRVYAVSPSPRLS
jgi:hypothetical protein